MGVIVSVGVVLLVFPRIMALLMHFVRSTMLRICSIGEVVEMLTADRSQKAHRDVHLLFLRLLKVMLPRNLRDIDKVCWFSHCFS